MAKTVNGQLVVANQVPWNTDHTDFNNWSVGSPSGAGAITIAGDGKSVTFTRDTPGDTGNLRQYLSFNFGPWAAVGDRIGIVFRVTEVTKHAGTPRPNAAASGSVAAVDSITRTVSAAGLYGMVVDTTVADLASFELRLGIGVAQLDTVTDSITISDVQVTRLEAGATQPDPLVNSFLPYVDNQPTLNGAIIGVNNDSYTPATGLITESAFTPFSAPTWRHGLLCGDSYVASIQTRVGFRWVSQYPGWVLSADGLGGRQLQTIADIQGGMLDDLLAVSTISGAEPPKWLVITAGGNDMLNNGKNATQLLSYDQAIYDWCVSNGLYYVKCNMPPIANAAAWDTSMRAITDNYNASLAANPFGEFFRVVDIYSALGDPGDATVLEASIDSGDGVHPTYLSAYNAQAGADIIIDAVLAVLLELAEPVLSDTATVSDTVSVGAVFNVDSGDAMVVADGNSAGLLLSMDTQESATIAGLHEADAAALKTVSESCVVSSIADVNADFQSDALETLLINSTFVAFVNGNVDAAETAQVVFGVDGIAYLQVAIAEAVACTVEDELSSQHFLTTSENIATTDSSDVQCVLETIVNLAAVISDSRVGDAFTDVSTSESLQMIDSMVSAFIIEAMTGHGFTVVDAQDCTRFNLLVPTPDGRTVKVAFENRVIIAS